jgi:hypothetical protein
MWLNFFIHHNALCEDFVGLQKYELPKWKCLHRPEGKRELRKDQNEWYLKLRIGSFEITGNVWDFPYWSNLEDNA